MKQCKPCITIRDVYRILIKNIKSFIKNMKEDLHSYSRVNATVCELDKGIHGPIPNDAIKAAISKLNNEVL